MRAVYDRYFEYMAGAGVLGGYTAIQGQVTPSNQYTDGPTWRAREVIDHRARNGWGGGSRPRIALWTRADPAGPPRGATAWPDARPVAPGRGLTCVRARDCELQVSQCSRSMSISSIGCTEMVLGVEEVGTGMHMIAPARQPTDAVVLCRYGPPSHDHLHCAVPARRQHRLGLQLAPPDTTARPELAHTTSQRAHALPDGAGWPCARRHGTRAPPVRARSRSRSTPTHPAMGANAMFPSLQALSMKISNRR